LLLYRTTNDTVCFFSIFQSPPPPKKKRFDVTKKKKMLSGVTDNAPNNSKKWTGEIQGGCTVAHGVSFLADLLVGSKKWRDDADEC
jgi:hypothetical protein